MSRRIVIYSTSSQSKRTIESSSMSWGQLQGDLTAHGIPYTGMNVVVGETQHTLESREAQLPQGEFTLFFMPQKVKSGSDSYLIDFDGVSWNDVDWYDEESTVEDHTFKTTKDLAIARLKRMEFYIHRVVDYLVNERKQEPTDESVQKLANMAEQIKNNMNIFD